ncbi:PH domain-containing protein [Paenibacillus kandeliae]|uniref:PH domain-containing protein n=1 Tax=Paenibacillus kandeliae TaxID=3231269 RepID=UPI003459633A
MNTEPRRQHILYLAFTVLKSIRAFAFPLVLMLFNIVRGDEVNRSYMYLLLVLALMIVIMNVYQIASWRKFTYHEEPDRFVIRSGLWTRNEKAIYYERIHSVSIEQPLLQRLLGVVQLKIETPGGSSSGDAVLEVLSTAEADRLQRVLNEQSARTHAITSEAAAIPESHVTSSSAPAAINPHASQQITDAPTDIVPNSHYEATPSIGEQTEGVERSATEHTQPMPTAAVHESVSTNHSSASTAVHDSIASPSAQGLHQPQLLYRLTTKQLLRAALTEMNLGLGLAVIAGVYSFAHDLIPQSLLDRLLVDASGYMSGIKTLIWAVVAGLFITWLLSLIMFIVKYADFSVYRIGERLSIRYGLLERRQFVFHPRHVQAVTVKESTIRRWLGYAQIQVHVISSDRSGKLPTLHPFVRRDELQELLDAHIPGFVYSKPQYHSPSRALLAYVWPSLLVCAVAGIVFSYFWSWYAIGMVLPAALLFWLDYNRYRYSGARLDGQRVIVSNRYIAHYTHCIQWKHIEAFQLRCNWMQQRRDLLDIRMYIAAGRADFETRRLERTEAELFFDWYSRRVPSVEREKDN